MKNCTLPLLNYTKQASAQKKLNTGKKKVYYISAEFLIGKLLSNNLINLGLYDDVKKELSDAGKDLIEVEVSWNWNHHLVTVVWDVWQPALSTLSQALV